jgi:hypothetical protein
MVPGDRHFHHTSASEATLRSRLPIHAPAPRTCQPQLIATISAGFEKGDYLIREEKGSNIYFDFFEEAFNFACQKGYVRMPRHEEMDYMEIIKRAHKSVPGGTRFNTGRLLMVLRKKLVPLKITLDGDEEPVASVADESTRSSHSSSEKRRGRKKLAVSTATLPTDSESSYASSARSTAYSSASTSYVDSWE